MNAAKQSESWNPLKDVNTWWFGFGSPVTLGLLRILMGLLALEELFIGLMDFEAWYTDKGFFPLRIDADYFMKIPATVQIGTHWDAAARAFVPNVYGNPNAQFPRLNIFEYAYDQRVALALYLLVMVAAVFTALGLWSRWSTIALAIGLVSVHHRNPLILHSGDTLLRVIIIYLAVAPSGLSCSVDRLIGLWKGTAPPIPRRVSLWPQRLIEFQVALVYFITVWFKWFGIYWKDGTASWYPENLNEFTDSRYSNSPTISLFWPSPRMARSWSNCHWRPSYSISRCANTFFWPALPCMAISNTDSTFPCLPRLSWVVTSPFTMARKSRSGRSA